MRRLRIGAWILGACAVASAGVADDGAGEAAAVPDAPEVSPRHLGFADFLPQSAGSDDCLYDAPSEGNGGFVAADAPGSVCCLVAGVRLPDGATVSSVFFYLRDSSPGDVTISLRRKRIDDETVSTAMGTVATSGSDVGVRIFSDVSIAQGLVDNRHYTYYVSTDTCLDDELDLRLLSGLIFFSEGS